MAYDSCVWLNVYSLYLMSPAFLSWTWSKQGSAELRLPRCAACEPLPNLMYDNATDMLSVDAQTRWTCRVRRVCLNTLQQSDSECNNTVALSLVA